MELDFSRIEKKWQDRWAKDRVFEPKGNSKKKKFYVLEMFPYPSASGLHMGHALNYAIGDVFARFKRMQGFNVLYPAGFDALGLPAENAAIKAKSHPKPFTAKAIENYIRQMKELGLSYDWSRIVKTCDSEYYKWNQFFFLKFFKKGLVYRKKAPVNWCPKCKTVLANEQVQGGKCWRHEDTDVEVKHLEQWFIKTTDYADELLDCIDELDWPERIKTMQRNWIGRSEGAEVEFEIFKEEKTTNKIANVVIVHGIPSNTEKSKDEKTRTYDKHWIPWIKRELRKRRIKCETPLMPEAWEPKYTVWKKEFDKLKISEGSILIGHSGGCAFLVRWLGETKKKIKKLILVAPWKIPSDEFPDSENELYNFEIDEDIKEKVNKIIIFSSNDEEKDGKESAKIYHDALNGRLIELENHGHYCLGDMGTEEFPELLDEIISKKEKWKIFTTRPDTIFGVTFMVVSAQHPRLMELVTEEQKKEVETFLKRIKSVSEKELENLEKDGVFTGSYAINPMTNEKIPVYAGNFVVADYGSGMVMAVPDHDTRDFEFAKKYGIKIKCVIKPASISPKNKTWFDILEGKECWPYKGTLINSGKFSGMDNEKAKQEITKELEKKGIGGESTQYKLRDWLISRQRYWGTPIPIIYCDKCSEKKIKILLIHGITGHNKENWFPWMKEQAEKFGVEFICPNLPNSANPTLDEWTEFLKPYLKKLDENSIIIGHSLGATTAMHLIQELKHKIDKLVLVAPTSKAMGLDNFRDKYQNEEYFTKETIDKIEDFVNKKIDFAKVMEKTNKISVYLSEDDPYIDFASLGYFKKHIQGDFFVFKNKGHFNEDYGVLEFPEILDILSLDRNPGIIPVPEKDLPIKLPEKVEFGEGNPLETNEKFVNVKCPKCSGKARRETDTMDTFFDSSWYFLRYCDSKNDKKPFDSKKVNYWMPVDQYIGGAEHACMHLIYARFFTKALRDLGFVKIDEPFSKLFNQGMLHGHDGEKMSKSKGNIVNPDEVSKKYGMDTARFFLLSLAAPDKPRDWSETGIQGSLKFIKKMFNYFESVKIGKSSKKIESKINKAIKETTQDIKGFRYNFAIIRIRELFESFEQEISKKDLENFIKILSPFCPHIAEEFWEKLANKTFISLEKWPVADESKINEKLEKQEKAVDKLADDINHIVNLMKEKQNKHAKKAYIYTLPKEKQDYSENIELLKKKTALEIKVFAVNDKEKYDPENKASKAKPEKPAVYIE